MNLREERNVEPNYNGNVWEAGVKQMKSTCLCREEKKRHRKVQVSIGREKWDETTGEN